MQGRKCVWLSGELDEERKMGNAPGWKFVEKFTFSFKRVSVQNGNIDEEAFVRKGKHGLGAWKFGGEKAGKLDKTANWKNTFCIKKKKKGEFNVTRRHEYSIF